MKLSQLANELSIHQPAVVEAHRRFKQHCMLNESRNPQTGLYYFVPNLVTKEWHLYPFFDEFHGSNIIHADVWAKYMSKIIGGKLPASAFAGLPRGRVIKDVDHFVVLHGNDTPGGKRGLSRVAQEFNLPRQSVRYEFDAEEQMNPNDFDEVKRILQYKQRLKKPPTPDWWA